MADPQHPLRWTAAYGIPTSFQIESVRLPWHPYDAQPGFVHLHVHSAYSLLEGALPISKLAEFAKADQQPALALTDTDNMFGALEFSEKLAGYGIQPIVGCALAVDFGDEARDPRHAGRAGRCRGSC